MNQRVEEGVFPFRGLGLREKTAEQVIERGVFALRHLWSPVGRLVRRWTPASRSVRRTVFEISSADEPVDS